MNWLCATRLCESCASPSGASFIFMENEQLWVQTRSISSLEQSNKSIILDEPIFNVFNQEIFRVREEHEQLGQRQSTEPRLLSADFCPNLWTNGPHSSAPWLSGNSNPSLCRDKTPKHALGWLVAKSVTHLPVGTCLTLSLHSGSVLYHLHVNHEHLVICLPSSLETREHPTFRDLPVKCGVEKKILHSLTQSQAYDNPPHPTQGLSDSFIWLVYLGQSEKSSGH